MKLKNENEKFETELAKINSKLESELRENRELIQQLAAVNFNFSIRRKIFLGTRIGTRKLEK